MDSSANPSNPEDSRTLEQMPTAPTVPASPPSHEAARTVEQTPTVPTVPANPGATSSHEEPQTVHFRAGRLVGEGRFELKRFLGQGGMGIVWLAFDKLLHEPTALKFLPPAIRGDPTALDDLRRETQRSRKLSHPHIVRIHDLFVPEGEDAFIAMEYVDGHSLSVERLKRTNKALDWEQLVPWVRQLCDALDYAHREQVIHRDLKPANLLLDGQLRLKLTDFGIARVVTDSVSRSAEQGSSGTTVYMSPQQLEGKPSLPTDDVYSLGATLYELLTTKPPFYTGDVEDQIRFRLPEPLSRRQRELNVMNAVPGHVERTIMACLNKDPSARPRNVQEVAERLSLQKKTRHKGSKSARQRASGIPETPSQDSGAQPSASGPELPPVAPTTRQGKPRSSKRRAATVSVTAETPRETHSWRRGLLWAAFIGLQILIGTWLVHYYSARTPAAPAAATNQVGTPTKPPSTPTAVTQPANATASSSTPSATPTTASQQPPAAQTASAPAVAAKQPPAPASPPQKPAANPTTNQTAMPAIPPAKPATVAQTSTAPATATSVVKIPEPTTKPATNQLAPPPPPPPYPVAGRPWTNTLGMILVPVSTDLPLFSVWETRVQDYRAFVTAAKRPKSASEWKAAGFLQASNHPAVNIRWHDARAFCQWLTETERSAGKLNTNQAYRLPRAQEWDQAAGLLSAVASPATAPAKRTESYLWGANWPPPTNAGNFFGQEAGFSGITAFRDGFTNTAPVGSFPPNRHGLYDLAGNAWEWCEDAKSRSPAERVVKGGSWQTSARAELVAGAAHTEQSYSTNIPLPYVGFRLVLEFQSTTNK